MLAGSGQSGPASKRRVMLTLTVSGWAGGVQGACGWGGRHDGLEVLSSGRALLTLAIALAGRCILCMITPWTVVRAMVDYLSGLRN